MCMDQGASPGSRAIRPKARHPGWSSAHCQPRATVTMQCVARVPIEGFHETLGDGCAGTALDILNARKHCLAKYSWSYNGYSLPRAMAHGCFDREGGPD